MGTQTSSQRNKTLGEEQLVLVQHSSLIFQSQIC